MPLSIKTVIGKKWKPVANPYASWLKKLPQRPMLCPNIKSGASKSVKVIKLHFLIKL